MSLETGLRTMFAREVDFSLGGLVLYAVPACLMLIAYIYLMKRHGNQLKQIEHQDQNQNLVLENQNDKKVEAIQSSFTMSTILFLSDSKKPFSKSQLGGRFGLFSLFDKPKLSKKAIEIQKKLPLCQTYKEASDGVITLLSTKGSLWDFEKGNRYSFNNYFLICLRYQNCDAYRDIVGRAYGIQFVTGEITLYRRDKRGKDIIFKNGFELKPGSSNDPFIRKLYYAEPATYSHGVSFAKSIPPLHYGKSHCYIVKLPPKHEFLLVDIVKSPRNKGFLTQYQLNLQEVNSLDDIPGVNIYACRSTIFASNKMTEEKINHYFEPVVLPLEDKRFKRGCY